MIVIVRREEVKLMSERWFSEEEMFRKEALWASVYLGVRAEGHDGSGPRALMKYWAAMRRKFRYAGGITHDANEAEAREYLAREEVIL